MKPPRHALSACGLILLFLASTVAPAAWAIRAPAPAPIPAAHVTPRTVAPTVPAPATASNDTPTGLSIRPAPTAPAAAPSPSPHASSPVVTAGWDALHFGTNGGISNGWVPPDVQVAAGPDHVVEMVNLLMGAYSKQGAQASVIALASLFNSGGDFISDPKIQYDPASARWFASVTDVTKGQVLLIVSTSTDPTLAWRHYAVPAAPTTQCLDQPILGVGTTSVIVSVNVFSSCTSNTYTYIGAQYWVVNKTDLLTGAAAPAMFASLPDVTEASIHPVQIQGSSDAHYMVSTYWPGTATTSDTMHLFTVVGTPPGLVSVTVTSLSMPTAAVPPAAGQAGSTLTLDSGDIRVSDATWADGRLWLGFSEACLADAARACVRLVEIDTTAETILQDFDVDVAGKHLFYPAFRLDGTGNLAVVVGYSSPSDYPGILATGRLSGDAPNTYQTPTIVVAGTGAERPASCRTTCRFGDYFGAGLDPSDPTVVWLAGQMGTASGWGTHVFGARVKAEITLAYAVRGGGTGYSAPTFSYVLNGTELSSALSGAPISFAADPGSPWSVSPVLPGSSSEERWMLNASAGAPPASGTVDASFNEILGYFHVYATNFLYSVSGSSSPPVPSVTYIVFGVAGTVSLAPAQARWADAGSGYAYESPIRGSTSIDRFVAAGGTTGTVAGAANVSVHYYHQFHVAFDYAVVGGGTGYNAPSVTIHGFGIDHPLAVPRTEWVDAGSPYSFDAVLPGSGAFQRWAAESSREGSIVDASRIVAAYTLEYRLSVVVSPSGAAALTLPSGWYAAGSVVGLAAGSNASWRFQGWVGNGDGAYSGPNANGTATMNGPISEAAAYYPGLTIVARPGGSVSFSYGSVSGTVRAGTSVTIFVPPGTTVALSATPSSLADGFGGWAGAEPSGSSSSSIRVEGPAVVTASFGANVGFVGVILAIVLAAVALLVLAVRRRKKSLPP